MLFWPTFVGAVVMQWTAPWVMRTIYGSANTGPQSGALLAALCWLVPVVAVRGHARIALVSLERQRCELVASAVGAAALVGLLAPLTGRYGAFGAAWAMVPSELLGCALVWGFLVPLLRDAPPAARGSGDAHASVPTTDAR